MGVCCEILRGPASAQTVPEDLKCCVWGWVCGSTAVTEEKQFCWAPCVAWARAFCDQQGSPEPECHAWCPRYDAIIAIHAWHSAWGPGLGMPIVSLLQCPTCRLSCVCMLMHLTRIKQSGWVRTCACLLVAGVLAVDLGQSVQLRVVLRGLDLSCIRCVCW